MIPKKIHYCWFGRKEKSSLVKKCINSWENKLKDYEIIEWNETNCDIENAPLFVKEAYNQQKRAFVSDYFRLVALQQHGGVYLDTDVEVLKDFGGLLELDFFVCFESEGYLCTAVIGSEKGNNIILNFLDKYKEMKFSTTPNSKLLYDFIFDGKENNIDKTVKINEGCYVFSSSYFSPKNFYTHKMELTKNTICIHHFDGTWKTSKQKIRDKIFFLVTKIFGYKTATNIKDKLKKKKR